MLVATVLIGASTVFASSWTNASGANTAFGWSSGYNNTDHFGNPTVSPIGFFFSNPVNFKAQVGTLSVTDFARVRIDTKDAVPSPGALITDILVYEWGTYSGQISDFSVQADFAIIRYDPAPTKNTGSMNLATTFYGDGTWFSQRWLHVGDSVPGFPPTPWTWGAVKEFQITVTNTIQVAGAAAANGAWIEKDGMRIITPEPSSILLLGFVGLLIARRSR
jgi:hypothetical protein